jgi:hypothetical protein
MIDEESDLRERFAQLRAEERRGVPRFERGARQRKRPVVWRAIAAAATLLLLVIVSMTVRRHRVGFSDSDRAVVRSVAEWHSPTDFLLRTPGSEMLTTTPRIPDLKGIPR